jgi:hypothetical protein
VNFKDNHNAMVIGNIDRRTLTCRTCHVLLVKQFSSNDFERWPVSDNCLSAKLGPTFRTKSLIHSEVLHDLMQMNLH